MNSRPGHLLVPGRNAENSRRRVVAFAQAVRVGVLLGLLSGAWPGAVPGAMADPQSFDALSAGAAAARDAGNIPQAIGLYGQAVELNPNWPDGWWFLGTLNYGQGNYPAGRDALSHFIALTPSAGPAQALRGLCEFETGEYPQALQDIEGGLALGAGAQARNEHILKSHEALLLTRVGRFEDALHGYAFFAPDGPPPPDMAIGIGLAGLRIPLLPKEVDPGQQDLYSAVGNAVFSYITGDKSAAQRGFNDLFLRYPTVPNLHYAYGYLLFPTDPELATAEFKRELEVDPGNTAAVAILAWSALMDDDPAGALPYAKQAEAAHPELAVSQLVLGRALSETGDLDGGMQHLEKALSMEPQNIEVHLALVKAYSKLGRKAEAARERQVALKMAATAAPAAATP